MRNYYYKVISNHYEKGEFQWAQAITLKMSRYKLKKYLRILLDYKHPDHELIFIYVCRCDENGVMSDNQRARFIKTYKDLR